MKPKHDPSLTMAIAIKRKAGPKKMASGGAVRNPKEVKPETMEEALKRQQDEINYSQDKIEKHAEKPKFAKGGKIPTTPRMAESSIIKSSPIDALGRKMLIEDEPSMHEVMEEDNKEREYEVPESTEITPEEPEEPEYAEGGMIDEDQQPMEEADEERHASIAAAIMAKKAKMMAEGGQVDIDSNNDEQPNAYYKANQAALKENYDEDFEDMSQPLDSNEHGDDIEADAHDMISQIRRKMKSKRV